MDFDHILDHAIKMLQRRGCLTYRALQAQFQIDDSLLDILKEELLYSQPQISDDGRGLVWTGDPASPEVHDRHWGESEGRFQAILLAVSTMLQRNGRVTYRTLKHAFSINDVLLAEIREELRLSHLAIDEESKVLVWTDAATNGSPTSPVVPSDRQHIPPEPQRSAPEAERRQLTVMFCDLVGSTDLSGRLDPEDLREVVRAYQETAAEVIERYEGHIAQYLGDGLLIYFGYPLAHENDAQRAVHTGLGIVEAMDTLNARLNADYGVALAVRIGIHTGPVVVGEMGSRGRHENLALGKTPNVAARLEGLASPNSVVISPVTGQLVQQSFVLAELGPHKLKGVVEPMQVFRVLGPTEIHRDEDESIPEGGVFLVGRDEEIGLLVRRWEQSKAGLGQVVLLSGEAGIGKSSLIANLCRHVHHEGDKRLTIRCSPYTTNSALYPIIEHVQKALDWQSHDAVGVKLAKLEQGLQHTHLTPTDAVPLLASLLSLSLPEDRYPPLSLSPGQQRQQTQDVLVAWLLAVAEHQPVLALWEDLHWSDPSTLELLGILLEQAPTAAMLHVLSFRPEFDPPWSMRSHMTSIQLNHLERPQIEALIQHLAGDKTVPEEVVEHIVAKTDGVPLFVEEMTKMLMASDLLREEINQYILTGPLLSVAIPNTLQDSLMARLDQLSSAKEVAQLGAVLGREFTFEMLQNIASLDEVILQTGLGQLVEAELLYQRGRPPRARYIFKHALVRDTAYQSLLKRSRQDLHHQVAQLLETRFPEIAKTQPELVAQHYTEADLAEQAIDYWQRAGQSAMARSAHVEAIAHLTQGLAVMAELPETPARFQQELELQMTLGNAIRLTRGNADPEVGRIYARARELCLQIGDTPEVFQVLRGLLAYEMVRGELQTAQRLGEEVLRLAESQSESVPLMLAHSQLGNVLFFRGESVAARTHHTQALAIYTPQEHGALALQYGLDFGVGIQRHLAFEQWALGYPDQALNHSIEACTTAEEVSHVHSRVTALIYAAVSNQLRRDVSATCEQAVSGLTLATAQGFANWATWGTVLQGWALAMQGQGEAGIAMLCQGLATYRASGARLMQTYFLALLAETYGVVEHPHQGFPLLTEALAMMDTTELRFYEAEIYRLQGQLFLQQSPDNAAEAEACFRKAIAVAQSQSAKSWELRAATSLAKLRQSQGKRRDAYDLLAPVYNWFTEGFDTADLQDAKALLNELAEVSL